MNRPYAMISRIDPPVNDATSRSVIWPPVSVATSISRTRTNCHLGTLYRIAHVLVEADFKASETPRAGGYVPAGWWKC